MVISTVTFIISTAEELQKDEEGRVDFPRIVLIIDLIDNFVVIFFTVEFLARLTVCPNKKRYGICKKKDYSIYHRLVQNILPLI